MNKYLLSDYSELGSFTVSHHFIISTALQNSYFWYYFQLHILKKEREREIVLEEACSFHQSEFILEMNVAHIHDLNSKRNSAKNKVPSNQISTLNKQYSTVFLLI